jgi:hypothetical protein
MVPQSCFWFSEAEGDYFIEQPNGVGLLPSAMNLNA